MNRETMNANELAKYCGISKDLVYQLVKEHKIPHIRFYRRILFRRESIDEWMSRQEDLSVQHDTN
jgi:excisionase family DNA binding protein